MLFRSKYYDYDFVACPLVAVNASQKEVSLIKHKVRFSYFENNMIIKETLLPYNSGVVFWKGNFLKSYGKQVLKYCNDLLYKKHPMSDMMYTLREDARNREEIACNLFIFESGLKHTYFDCQDVDIYNFKENPAILHSSSTGFPYIMQQLAYDKKLVPN